MDNQLEPVSLENFNKLYEERIQAYHELENYLENSYTVYNDCLTVTILCQGLESKNLEGATYTRQCIESYYTKCDAKLKKRFAYHESLPLDFDDLAKLEIQLSNLKDFTESLLSLVRYTCPHIERLPELLYVCQCMRAKGIPTDDIDESFEKTEAEVEQFLASQPNYKGHLKQADIKLNTYCIQVQKLERWIHQKAIETSLVIPQPPPAPITPTANINPNIDSTILAEVNEIKAEQKETKNANQSAPIILTINQMGNIYEKARAEGKKEAILEMRKKQRARTRNSGGGRKPKFDTNNLQCEAYLKIRKQLPHLKPHACASKVLNDPKWEKPEYKEDNPFLYAPGMTKEKKCEVRKSLIKRATRYDRNKR